MIAATVAAGTPARANPWGLAGGASLTFYGQINMGWLSYGDGQQTYTYFPVDNDNSSTRAGLYWVSASQEWAARFEAEYQPRPSNKVSQLDPDVNDWTIAWTNIRKLEVTWQPGFGAFSIGQGSMASDGIAEIDLSGTAVVAYSSITGTAAGNLYRLSDGSLSDITVGDTAGNFDGSRRMRIRYDTPDWNGFGVAAAYGQEVLKENDNNDYYDIALRYGGSTDSWVYQAGAGYNWKSGDGATTGFWGASGSVINTATGINGTLALGADDGDASYWYGKLGLKREFWSFGATALSVDYYDGSGFAAAGSSTRSWSLAAVQTVTRADLELYAVWRDYSYDDAAASHRNGQAFMTGARWKW